MTKELFVSSTPHETKVGMVEDDLLAEVYLERENEYTLAGSIYKGRVTRVLPGMQSAFVDIGLERDAFLYVSDFMELEDTDDVEEVSTDRPVQERRPQPRMETQPVAAVETSESQTQAEPVSTEPSQASEPRESSGSGERNERGGWRGRRRRGRGGRRGERGLPESKYSRPVTTEPAPERNDFGPPPGYEPILLPGESISKYRRNQAPVASPRAAVVEDRNPSLAATFPDDEPEFAKDEEPVTTLEQSLAAPVVEEEIEEIVATRPAEQVQSPSWIRQPETHQTPIESAFEETVEEEEELDDKPGAMPEATDRASQIEGVGTMTEEEIEEDEADLAHYVEELEDDDFVEMEEETTAAGDLHHEEHSHEIAAVGEPPTETVVPFSADPISEEQAAIADSEEVEDEAEEEDELEE